MQLHQRGVDLLVNVLDAADRAEQLAPSDVRELLKEVAQVIGQILEQDALIALNGLPDLAAWTERPAGSILLHSTQPQSAGLDRAERP